MSDSCFSSHHVTRVFLLSDLVLLVLQAADDGERGSLQLFARLSDYNIYTSLNAKNQLRAPTEFGLCLRAPGREDPSDLRCLACETEQVRTCWLTAMRLAKVSTILLYRLLIVSVYPGALLLMQLLVLIT